MNYNELYDLTIKELLNILEQKRKGLAYRIWKEANLIGVSLNNPSNFPASPEEACPELYPPKTSIKMPNFLLDKWLKKRR